MTELMALGLAAVGTYLWRALGVSFAGRLKTDTALFQWITCVTYAMVAGLVVRILLLPVGLLSRLPWWARMLACLLAILVMAAPAGGPFPRFRGLVPALLTGSLVLAILGLVLL